MRICTTWLLVGLITAAGWAQVPNFPAIIGLTFQNRTLTPTSVVPISGQTQLLTNQATSPDHFLSGNSTLDVSNQIYYYVSSNPARLYGFNLTTAQLQYNYLLPRDSATTFPLAAIQYHPGDSVIYGIRQQTNGLFLVSFDPRNGQVTPISMQPIAQATFHSGDATLDTASGTFYLPWGTKNSMLAAIDIRTGQSQTIMVNDPLPSPNTIARILNVQYNYNDGYIYGLHFTPGALRFVKMQPASGLVTLVSNGPISADMFQVGNCTFDQQNEIYYYTRTPWGQSELVAVDIDAGQVLAAPMLSLTGEHASFVNPEYNSLALPAARFRTALDCDNSMVLFGNQSMGSQFEWDFGDGNTSTDIHPKHRYAQPGTYTVQLRAHAHGQTNTFTQQVDLHPPLAIEIDGPDRFFAGERATLQVDAGMHSYSWSHNHSNTPTSTITHGGTYSVTVSNQGCTATATKHISNDLPFTMDKSAVMTTSYEKEFSSALTLTGVTNNTTTYFIRIDNQGSHNNAVLFRGLSASGGITINKTQPFLYRVTIPKGANGTIHVNWYALQDGLARVIMTMEHPFGGTMEEVTFIGMARLLTHTADPTLGKALTCYPNPVAAGTAVNWTAPLPAAGQIVDVNGRVVSRVMKGDTRTELPTVAGLYNIVLQSGDRFSLVVTQ